MFGLALRWVYKAPLLAGLRLAKNTIAAAAMLSVILLAVVPFCFDFGQCDRACRLALTGSILPNNDGRANQTTYAGQLSGKWLWFSAPSECACFERGSQPTALEYRGKVARLFQPIENGYPYVEKGNGVVCGADGTLYTSRKHAMVKGVSTMNCGPCGACSNNDDLHRVAQLEKDLFAESLCMVSFLLFPPLVDQFCLQDYAGLSTRCAQCWVEYHGCLMSHCYYSCAAHLDDLFYDDDSWRKSPCNRCKQSHCAKAYVDSCGANTKLMALKVNQAAESQVCVDP